jgi:hypothetical protein
MDERRLAGAGQRQAFKEEHERNAAADDRYGTEADDVSRPQGVEVRIRGPLREETTARATSTMRDEILGRV